MKRRQNPTDRFLLSRYREGETSILPILVKRYHKSFCEKAFWVTKDKEMSKDIAQECWFTIINNLHALNNLDSFESWAYRIVYTKSIDSLKRKNQTTNNLRAIGNMELKEETTRYENNSILKALKRAIGKLSKEKQDVIRLFYLEEYSILEISDFLCIPKGTVKSRLFKAREK